MAGTAAAAATGGAGGEGVPLDDLGFGGQGVPDPRVDYCLYPSGDDELEGLLERCLAAAAELSRGYIWQLEAFALRSSLAHPPPAAHGPPLVPHLWGTTLIGDNIEDEWFIVFLLAEITRRVPGVAARVWDEDGEFLLAEAAYEIPRWLKPETAANRVFLWGGRVHIIPYPATPADIGVVPVAPTLAESVALLASGRVATEAAEGVQGAVGARTEGYPGRAASQRHRARALLPARVAHALRREPGLIAAAVGAFYTRDVDDMAAAAKMTHIPPTDVVAQVVTMTKCLYAQLKLQELGPPKGWPLPLPSEPAYASAELGMKISAGFEMLLSRDPDAAPAGGGGGGAGAAAGAGGVPPAGDRRWAAFRRSLEASGYFRGELEGSRLHRELLDAAVSSYREASEQRRTAEALSAPAARVRELFAEPHSKDDFKDPGGAGDDDAWLHVSPEDIDREIRIAEGKDPSRSKGATHDEAPDGTFSIERLVEGVAGFVGHGGSGPEGAEVPAGWGPEGAGAGTAVSFDQDRFLDDLEEALGIHGTFPREGRAEKGGAVASSSDSDDESDEEFYGMGEDSDDEDGGGGGGGGGRSGGRGRAGFMGEYIEALESQLAGTSLGGTFGATASVRRTAGGAAGAAGQEGGGAAAEGGEAPEPIDIDMNLVTGMLQSYSAQEGLAGPASNLAGLLGLTLPDDADRDRGTPGPTAA